MNATPLIVSWGELVWDFFPNREPVLGGCACNSATHALVLGARTRLVSALGGDDWGHAALAELARRGIASDWIQVQINAETARVRVSVEPLGLRYAPMIRFDWKALDFSGALASALHGADALMFSAFAQGSQLELAELREGFARAGRPRLVGCDLNLRHPLSQQALNELCGLVDFIKLNEDELVRLGAQLGSDPLAFLLDHGELGFVVETRAARGARLATRDGYVELAAPKLSVGPHCVGAGDAFMAALTHALLIGAAPQRAVEGAVEYASAEVARRCGENAPG